MSTISTSSYYNSYSLYSGYSSVQGGTSTTESLKTKQQEIFSQADTNEDGSIDSSEFAAMLESMPPPPPPPSGSSSSEASSSEDLFASIDTDGDGSLSQEELEANAEKMREEMRNKFDLASLLGTPGQAEGEDSKEDLFSKIDTDGDGVISEDEFTAHEQKMREGIPSLAAGSDEQSASDSTDSSVLTSSQILQFLNQYKKMAFSSESLTQESLLNMVSA